MCLSNSDASDTRDLNALIAHAHARVDELRRQLVEKQVSVNEAIIPENSSLDLQLREQQNIDDILTRERANTDVRVQQQLKTELERANSQQNAELERRLNAQRDAFEEQMREQMRCLTATHLQHLEVDELLLLL